jgi:DNA-binding NarL/FixJ family response regulator
MNVLVVEDYPAFLDAACMMIEQSCGHEIAGRYYLPEAGRTHYDWSQVDVVLSDLRIPTEGEGIEWLSWLRLTHPDIPVIVMTASESDSILLGHPEVVALCHTILFKPFHPDDLCNALTEVAGD